MYYIKCPNCGHPNELKTEYQTFCSSCGKLLENSYKAWKKHNETGSFEDYKTSECLSETDLANETRKKKLSKAKGIKYGIITAIIVSLSFGVAQFFSGSVANIFMSNPNSVIDAALMRVADEVNKSCPMMIDSETRIDNCIGMPNKTLQYNYTLVNYDENRFNAEDVKAYLEPLIINSIKTDPQMQELKEKGVTFKYDYKDNNRIHLFSITVTPELYNE